MLEQLSVGQGPKLDMTQWNDKALSCTATWPQWTPVTYCSCCQLRVDHSTGHHSKRGRVEVLQPCIPQLRWGCRLEEHIIKTHFTGGRRLSRLCLSHPVQDALCPLQGKYVSLILVSFVALPEPSWAVRHERAVNFIMFLAQHCCSTICRSCNAIGRADVKQC